MPRNELKLGQLLVFGFQGKTVPSHIEKLIDNNNLGGVILFSRNGDSGEDFFNLTQRFMRFSAYAPYIIIDQEGGRVSRMSLHPDLGLSASELAAMNDHAKFRDFNARVALSLGQHGFDVNTVPVLDIPSSGDIPVLKGRCYGDNPEMVSSYSSMVIDIYLETGILCCAKHFPGLGDVEIDPHHSMPVDTSPLSRYHEFKLLPFSNAIAHRVPMIMTTHVIAEALDAKAPVTFSEKAVEGILRKKMAFDGLIISDDLEMGAISSDYSWEETIERTITAGHQLLLICHSQDKQLAALDFLRRLTQKSTSFRNIAINSVTRVLRAKRTYFNRILWREKTASGN